MSEPILRSWKERLLAWFREGFVPEPTGRFESALMRVGVAVLVFLTVYDPHPYDFVGQPAPVGIAHWVNLTWLYHPLHPYAYPTMYGAAALLGVIYIWGLVPRLIAPLLAAVHIIVRTYNNSQGFTHHGEQLISMVLVVQTLTLWFKGGLPREQVRAWLWYYSRGLILFAYCASGVTKLINSHGQWLWRSQHLVIELVSSRRFDYYRNLDPEFAGDPPIAGWLLRHPFLTQVLFGYGLFIELFAFLGLRDRKWSAIMGLALIALHVGADQVMDLGFYHHQALCLIFLVNVPGWLMLLWARRTSPASLAR